MKKTLLRRAERMGSLALALLMSLCAFVANAQLTSDEISAAILVEGSVPVKWTNDATHPWYIEESSDGNYIRTPEKDGDSVFESTLSFTYTSAYPTEITCEWYRYRLDSNDILRLLVDDEEKASTISHDWRYYNPRIIIPAGTHTVKFVSKSQYNSRQDYYFAGVRKLLVWECKELESACLKEGSLPLTFTNDPDNPWITEDGYIRTSSQYVEEATSKISTTFTIDKASLFSMEIVNGNTSYISTRIIIDGVEFSKDTTTSWKYKSVVLYPGTHIVEIEHYNHLSGNSYYTYIRNVRLDQNWYDITLNNPGELAVKITQALGDKNLQDVELLKVKGSMNTDDWDTIKKLTGIEAVDFTESNITEIPINAFSSKSHLSTVMLPETLKTIGENAFYQTNFYRATIPASVEAIDGQAWYKTPLRYIDFADGSNLKTIGYRAFAETLLKEFIMPNTVVNTLRPGDYIGYEWSENSDYYGYNNWDAFSDCSDLKKLHLSEGLTVVPRHTAYNCTSLEEVNIPSNTTKIEKYAFYNTNIKSITIPETVNTIREYAFANTSLESFTLPVNVSSMGKGFLSGCTKLKKLILNSHCWNMDYNFSQCTALETVVLPCATPPSITNNPFYGVTRSQIQLYVPDFAYESYKTDSYWYNFTNTKISDEASINDYWSIRGNLNLNSTHTMRGTPTIDMATSSVLTVEEGTSQKYNEVIYHNQYSYPASFLSRSNSVEAEKVETRYYVDTKDKWFFFSPVVDVKMSDVSYPSTDSWVIRYYDGARRASQNANSGNWVNVPADGTLHSGQGYIFQAKATGWLYLPAASKEENSKFLGSNEVVFDLADNSCETAANAGWNFVANPYPCYYDIYYIDMQAPITVWTGSTYKAYSLNDGDRGDDTFVLRPMQPFFVQKSSSDLRTGMTLAGRQTNTAIDRTRAPRKAVVNEDRHKLNLEIMGIDREEAEDYTRIVLNEEASLDYELTRDASKFMSLDGSVAQIYSIGEDNIPMAINERPYSSGSVALGVYLPESGKTYSIAARRADRKAWIYDAVTGVEQDLTEGDYIFMSDKAGFDNGRFTIRFAPSTGVVAVGSDDVRISGNAGEVSVSAPAGASIAVYGIDGAVMASVVSEGETVAIPLTVGVYVVTVDGESFKTVVK